MDIEKWGKKLKIKWLKVIESDMKTHGVWCNVIVMWVIMVNEGIGQGWSTPDNLKRQRRKIYVLRYFKFYNSKFHVLKQ